MIEFSKEEVAKPVKSPLREGLEYLRDEYAERRTDVSDIANSILQGKSLEEIKNIHSPEYRFVKFKFHGKQFIYDTLTTIVETNGQPLHSEVASGEREEWKTLKCDYED